MHINTHHYTTTPLHHYTTTPLHHYTMPKERLHLTVDERVKQEVKARDDLNVSGAVNDFLSRRLRGESKDGAAKRITIKRKRSKADDLEAQAASLRREADVLEQQLEEQREEAQQRLENAIDAVEVRENTLGTIEGDVYVKNTDEQMEFLADQAGVPPAELKNKAIERFKNDETDPTYQ